MFKRFFLSKFWNQKLNHIPVQLSEASYKPDFMWLFAVQTAEQSDLSCLSKQVVGAARRGTQQSGVRFPLPDKHTMLHQHVLGQTPNSARADLQQAQIISKWIRAPAEYTTIMK